MQVNHQKMLQPSAIIDIVFRLMLEKECDDE